MKKTILVFLLIFSVLSVNAAITLGFSGENAAQVGVYIKDLATGEVIASNDEEKAMIPASVMKAVTAATAYTALGQDFRFSTKIYLTGTITAGVCSGNLIIESCGDPTIDSENFDDRPTLSGEIISALNAKGITEIKGDVTIVETLSQPGCIPQWEIDDVAWSYGAGLYGFNFRDNTFKLWPATKKTVPFVPDLNVTVMTDTSEDLVRGINSNNLTAYGKKPHDAGWRVNTTMNDPAEVFKYMLKEKLAKQGIKVGNRKSEAKEKTLLMTHLSPPLNEILTQMMVNSHNLFAEGMLRALVPTGTRKQAIEKEIRTWKDRGISTSYNKIMDGSGLARGDRLQPILIANVLEWMSKSKYCADYVAMFPRVGMEGTVKNLLKDSSLKGTLVLKSGSMNAVQCYAGYKIDENGLPTHIVVILINSFYCERGQIRGCIEKFLFDTFNPTTE